MKQLARVAPPPLAIVLALSSLLIWGSLTRGHDWGDDFAQYIMQAISIVEGRPEEFIEANRFTVERSSREMAPVAYPWGYPLLLAPIYALFGFDIVALKVVGALCFVLFLAVFWFSLRREHSTLVALSGVALFALNPYLIAANDDVNPDVPFMFVSFLAVTFIGRVIVRGQSVISPPVDHLLLGALIAVAFLVRGNGLLLLPALLVAQLIASWLQRSFPPRRGSSAASADPAPQDMSARRIGVSLLPYVSFAVITTAFAAVLPEGGASYPGHLSRLTPEGIRYNLHYYIDLPAEFFDGVPHAALVYGASIPLAVLGMLRGVRSDYHIIAFVLLTVGLFIFWPDTQGLRFLFPILPFYVWFVFKSIHGHDAVFAAAAGDRWKRALWIVSLCLVLFYFARVSTVRVSQNLARNGALPYGPYVEASQEMFSFIAEQVPAESTVLFFKPRLLTLYTGRPSLLITTPDQIGRGDYLCVYRDSPEANQMSSSDIEQLIAAGHLDVVYRNDEFQLYRVNTSGQQ